MIALDASVLIGHLYPGDIHHDQATQLLADTTGERLLAHSLTLAEVLVGGVRTGRGSEMSADLLAIGVEVAGHADEEPLRLATLRASTGLKLPDCCVLDVARARGATVATFDESLARVARRIDLTVAP